MTLLTLLADLPPFQILPHGVVSCRFPNVLLVMTSRRRPRFLLSLQLILWCISCLCKSTVTRPLIGLIFAPALMLPLRGCCNDRPSLCLLCITGEQWWDPHVVLLISLEIPCPTRSLVHSPGIWPLSRIHQTVVLAVRCCHLLCCNTVKRSLVLLKPRSPAPTWVYRSHRPLQGTSIVLPPSNSPR